MEAIIERCCGLDVHKARVVACVLVGEPSAKPKREVRTFSTFTRELVKLAEWLRESGCTHVAMESTGVYWKPVYAVLEAAGGFELVVGNAHHMKNVPGRKTDVKDAHWIADLLRHGLIKRSFVPSQELRELRDLTRCRKVLVSDRVRESNRILKVLEAANIKLSSVATDVLGVSGRLMLDALIKNELTPKQMAELARGRLRKKTPELELALEGRVGNHERLMLRLHLEQLDAIDARISQLEKYIDERMEQYSAEVELLSGVPGIDKRAAAAIIAEVGTDMTVFPTQKAFCAWVGTAPGNNESAGVVRRASARKGNQVLRTLLVQCAWAAVRTKGTFWRDKYYRLRARRGEGRAVFAIAHKLARAIYAVLKEREAYDELGQHHLDEVDKRRTTRNLVRRLERLGYGVQLTAQAGTPATAAA